MCNNTCVLAAIALRSPTWTSSLQLVHRQYAVPSCNGYGVDTQQWYQREGHVYFAHDYATHAMLSRQNTSNTTKNHGVYHALLKHAQNCLSDAAGRRHLAADIPTLSVRRSAPMTRCVIRSSCPSGHRRKPLRRRTAVLASSTVSASTAFAHTACGGVSTALHAQHIP